MRFEFQGGFDRNDCHEGWSGPVKSINRFPILPAGSFRFLSFEAINAQRLSLTLASYPSS